MFYSSWYAHATSQYANDISWYSGSLLPLSYTVSRTAIIILYIHLYSPMNGRKNAKQYKNNAVTLTILKYSATVIEHI